MVISHQELQTIAFTLANEESPLLHFKSGFVDGEHQLIAVFSECEEVINTCWGCQMDNVKKLNDLMGCTPSDKHTYQVKTKRLKHQDGEVFWGWEIRNKHGALVENSSRVFTEEEAAEAAANRMVTSIIAEFKGDTIDPDKCPACDCTDIVGESVSIEGTTAKQGYFCSECDNEWYNLYELSSQV
ncbi:hypothetical protein SIPHO067v1_p0004 [Vibrio phage 51E28.1]|nr:hypothetical protein SIPHO068v1_p0097 [Vibrio phage 51E28.4]QZI92844.1 hypothetical protein SIPHO067v1_p0004 [Vibrio phage 51E28.1]